MLFRKLGLPDPESFGSRYPHQVSGGQLQRAMTAMALCPKPDLVVFDEPTTALDVTTQIDVLAAIKEAIRDTGVAALYITHDLAVVAQVADDIMVLRHGKKVEYGPAQIITAAEDYTRALVSVRSIDHVEKAEAPAVLSVQNVTARYRRHAFDVLKNVTVDLPAGQTLAVVGESGSGKSTLARAITGLLPPSAGADHALPGASFRGLAGAVKDDLRELQMIYQMADVAMNPRQTVGTIIGRPLEFYFGMKGEREAPPGAGTARPDRDGQGLYRPLSGGTVGRPEAARLHRARAGGQAEAHHLRRGDERAGSAGGGRHPEAAAEPAGAGGGGLSLHHP
jgi:peptide/nickel transport system ATP-binding protein